MNIRPIRKKADYQAAITRIEQLWDAAKGSPEFDELEVLATLVDAYEKAHHPIDPPDPIEAIKFRMEQMGLTRKDMEPYLGSRARVSEILRRKRNLSLPMIRRLHRGLGIPSDVLIAG